MRLNAKWTNDCQGKQDYDGDILSISTRYHPRGGGFALVTNNGPNGVVIQQSEDRPHIKPSATSALVLWHEEDEMLDLAEQRFEGDSEAEVKAQVEVWAQAQMDRAVRALKAEFKS